MLSKIRKTAAQILAAALFEAYPNVQIVETKETGIGFSASFFFPHPIHPEFLLQTEERMKQIIREKREIRTVEMVPVSAQALLQAKGHEIFLEEEGLVEVIEMGSFFNLSEGPHLSNTHELPHFKLLSLKEGSEKYLQIIGTAFSIKEELKDFLKKWNEYPKKRHEKTGEERNLFRLLPEGIFWLPGGMRLKKQVMESVEEHWGPGISPISLPKGADRKTLLPPLLETGPLFEIDSIEGSSEEGLFNPPQGTLFRGMASLEKSISFLQSMGKTLNMLGFSYSTILAAPLRRSHTLEELERSLRELKIEYDRVEGKSLEIAFVVDDALGRPWKATQVGLKEGILVSSLVVERIVALLLEAKD